ncbi:MAG: TonB-dependent receptor domain-containing protein [Salinibacter sp.]|uniref:TonB-dependent receptor n=1 Tax=Salinibacter sp. TaxID=2065818 RepID=UPI0035D42A1B
MSRISQPVLLAGLYVLCIAFMGPPAAAQESASLNGYVRDAKTGETLLQANVVVKDTRRGAATNNSGYYTIQDLAPGTYTIVFSYLGYRTRTEKVTLEAGETRRLDVELPRKDLQTDEVVVTGTRGTTDQEVGVDKLQTASITQLPSVLEPDVFRSLALLPGITTASDYSSSLYIRGGSPAQTLIQLDRTTVYNPTHFFGFYSSFNPDAIKDVKVYKGGYPAEYGGRLGSVIDIYNKDGNRQETTGGLHLGLLASRSYIEGPYGTGADGDPAGSYMIAVRRSTLEPVLAALNDIEGVPESFHFYDINGKISYDAGPNDKLSLSGYGGRDQLNLDLGNGGQSDVQYGNRTLSAEWSHIFSDQVFSTVSVAGSRYESTPEFEFGGTRFTQTNEVTDVSLKADLDYTPGEQHSIEAGLRASTLTFRLRNTFDGEETFEQNLRGQKAALYLKDTYEPLESLTLRGGLRAAYFSEGSFWRLSPRFSVKYDVMPSVRLEAAYGRYHQFLTLETSQLFTAFDTWLMADKGVPPSYGDQFILGANADLGGNWQLEVEGYARTMRDLFERDPFLSDQAGVPYAEQFHFGEGRAYGGELLLRRPEGRLNGFLSYTLGRTERKFPNINLSETGRPQYYPPNYDRTHTLTLAANYHLTKKWRLSSTFEYATGQAYTRPKLRYRVVDSPFPFSPGTSESGSNVFVSPFNNARLPAYHRLDLGIARTGRFFGIADYELQFQVVNAYARRNIWFYQYDTQGEEPVTRTVVPQIPVPIPNISFSLTF